MPWLFPLSHWIYDWRPKGRAVAARLRRRR
jgi:hypothetical protein